MEREKKKKKKEKGKKEGKSTRGCVSAEAGVGERREEGRGERGREGKGIYIQRDQGEIEIETSGTTMAVEIRWRGEARRGMKGFEVAIARNSRFARLRASAETAICIGNYTG